MWEHVELRDQAWPRGANARRRAHVGYRIVLSNSESTAWLAAIDHAALLIALTLSDPPSILMHGSAAVTLVARIDLYHKKECWMRGTVVYRQKRQGGWYAAFSSA
jgi:hypothetical protein